MRRIRVLFGVIVWMAIVCLAWLIGTETVPSSDSRRALTGLMRFWAGQYPMARLRLPSSVEVAVGDPIFVRDVSGDLRQVGEVRAIVQDETVLSLARANATGVEIFLFPTAPAFGPDAEFTYFTTPDSLVWVVDTLLTPERKALVTYELRTAYQQYRVELIATLQPMLQGTFRDSWVVIEQELPGAIQKHAQEIEALGAKYQQEIVDHELVPLAKREIWPLVQRRAEPVIDSVGIELWERVSLWRFGWRAAYDRSPLPDRHLLEREWQRFVRYEALPILSRHSDDMIDAVRGVIQDAAHNDAVQAGVQRSLSHVAADPEFQQLVTEIFKEVFIFNPRLRAVIERHWTGPEAQLAVQLASDRLEPTVRRIADLLFGSFEHGITPEFAQVLRTRILAKDQRWFLLDPKSDGMDRPDHSTRIFTARIAAQGAMRPSLPEPPTPDPAASARGLKNAGGGL